MAYVLTQLSNLMFISCLHPSTVKKTPKKQLHMHPEMQQNSDSLQTLETLRNGCALLFYNWLTSNYTHK